MAKANAECSGSEYGGTAWLEEPCLMEAEEWSERLIVGYCQP